MPSHRPKSLNGLMKHLRDDKGIKISGSTQKRKLMNMGYYHGYKGYRYVRYPANAVHYNHFDELMSVYEFDAKLKALFYPQVMFLETAIKNYVLDVIVTTTKSDSFLVAYNSILDNYKKYSTAGKAYRTNKEQQKAEETFKSALKKRLELRNRIYKVQTDAYANDNKIANHFLSRENNLPIWAIFELLSLGEFGHFVSCINDNCRKKISLSLGIRPADDAGALLPQRLIYAIRDLRNAIAHNDVIFDTRFRTGKIDKQVSAAIMNTTGVPNINFETITDYLILVVYLMKSFHITKTEIKRFVSEYEIIVESLRYKIPIGLFNKIIYTDNSTKINKLKIFISK